jgi:tRNA C32,U32 (ribose-2'-O)-methylase TrmJ
MKKSTLKVALFAIIPIIVVIVVGIYVASRIPQVRFGIAKYVTNWSLDRNVRKGKMSQEGANKIKQAVNRIFIISEKLENLGVDEEIIDREIAVLATSQEFQQISEDDGLSDEEVEVLLKFLNKIAERLEELAQQAEPDSP